MKVIKSRIKEIKAGDRIVSVNKNKIEDILDLQYHFEDSIYPEIEFTRKDVKKSICLKIPQNAFVFKDSVNKMKLCNNDCIFCFINQLPKGLRKSLYIKDDDYRLSLLYGNFITLTNLSEKDIEKITSYRISPIYVSLHSADKGIRRKIFGRTEEGLENFRILLKNGIEFHVQIVVVRGLNDGKNLKQTLKELVNESGVISVGIVPAAKTKYSKADFDVFDKESAKELIETVDNTGRKVYLADEFFLLAGQAIPRDSYYNDYPQIENGIGLSRKFLDACRGLKSGIKAKAVTGELAYPIVAEAMKDCPGIEFKKIKNSLFGDRVTVAGLLSGRDIIRTVSKLKGLVIIPDIMINGDGLFLDGLKVSDIKKSTTAKVEFVPSTGERLINRLKELN